jgi:hypothetical protein
MKNTVTQEQINDILKNSEIEVKTVYGKVTVVCCKLPNGFVITEASGAVDPANYDEKIGVEICMERITNKLWELEGYVLAKRLAERVESDEHSVKYPPLFTFGEVINLLKNGCKCARKGWKGKCIYIELQRPNEHSKITQPYIYIVTTAPKVVVPWLASQTDMLAADWYVVEE